MTKRSTRARRRRMARIGRQMAYLAGSGASAAEIATAVGLTESIVRRWLSRHCLPLVAKRAHQIAFPIPIRRKSRDVFERVAMLTTDEPAPSLIGRCIDALAREPALIPNILDDGSVRP